MSEDSLSVTDCTLCAQADMVVVAFYSHARILREWLTIQSPPALSFLSFFFFFFPVEISLRTLTPLSELRRLWPNVPWRADIFQQ